MPFPPQTLRVFSRENVLAITPHQVGCYGLIGRAGWIYVGKGDIRERLLDHLRGGNPMLNTTNPTHWVVVMTTDCDSEEARLIAELRPICNRKVG